MPNKKLVVFIAKRVLICYILVSIIVLILVEQKWIILAGLFLGAVISLIRFSSYGIVFERIFLANVTATRKGLSIVGSLAIFAINQLILVPLLFIAYKLNPYFFAGIFAGLLFLPFILFVNCLTEATGITHNNFE